jgi:hypothetical protein
MCNTGLGAGSQKNKTIKQIRLFKNTAKYTVIKRAGNRKRQIKRKKDY